MKSSATLIAILGVLSWAVSPAQAANPAVLSASPGVDSNPFAGLEYSAKVALYDTLMENTSSVSDKRNIALNWTRHARHAGEPRLQRQFKNFSPKRGAAIDVNDPHVISALRKLGINNKNAVKGTAREIVYYQKLYNSPFFTRVTIGQEVPTGSGVPSDQDLRLRSVLTGKSIWIEVKDTRSPLRLDTRLRNQLKRMSQHKGRRILISRGEVSDSVKKQARKLGVEVYEKVPSSQIEQTVLRAEIKALRYRGAFSASMGLLLVANGAWRLYGHLTTPGDTDARQWRAVAGDATLVASGCVQLAGGVTSWKLASIASETGKEAAAVASKIHRLATVGKWLRRTGWTLLVIYEGVEIYRWLEGDMNNRAFVANQGQLGGILAGAAAGAAIGAILDGPLPFGEAIGAVVGGVAGGMTGRAAASAVYDQFVFSSEEARQRRLELLEASIERKLQMLQ